MKDLKSRLRTAGERQAIIRVAAQWFALTVDDLTQKDGTVGARSRALSIPRHIAIFLCREQTDSSQEEVAQTFNRDRTLVPCAEEAVRDNCAAYVEQRTELDAIRQRVVVELAELRKEKT